MTKKAEAGGPRRAPWRWPAALSLRVRLLLALIALAAVALVAAAISTHTLLASFLLQRFDDQQSTASQVVFTSLFPRGPGGGRFFNQVVAGENSRLLPTGSYWAAVDVSSKKVVAQQTYDADTNRWQDVAGADGPLLPSGVLSRTAPFTVSGSGGVRYRVLVDQNSRDLLTDRRTGANAVYVFAMPLRDVDQTLDRLTRVEAWVTGGVLVALGLLVWLVVSLGLRPLRKMEASADAIVAGDLSRRIEHPDPRTEVGRLGLALNTMLGRIQEAFSARAASEMRMRRFLADASHELRTPLTSIRGYAELFRRGAAARPADLEKAMRRIEEEAARMGLLVDELLLLARLDRGRQIVREPVLLAELAADACDDLRTAAPDREVRLDANPDAVVGGDEMRLRQVIANLLANARTHTPAGTPIEVRVDVEGETVVMEVTDHGPGLRTGDIPHVFDRFYRADQSRARDHGGSGLGLAIVAAVVQSHGGRVGVVNVYGAGARFRVELPLLEADPGSADTADTAATDGAVAGEF